MSEKHVELSTVFFYPKGERPPSQVNLSDCGPPMLSQNDESITCLYGLRHRRIGFKQIHDYATKHNLDYEVVDMKLPVKEAPTTVTNDNLGNQDVLSLARISGEVKQKLYDGMGISSEYSRTEQQAKLIDTLSSNPNSINKLRESLSSSDVPLVIHPTRLAEGEESIAVANLAKSSCANLIEVTCRTKKSITINNDIGSVPISSSHDGPAKNLPQEHKQVGQRPKG